MPTMTVPEVRLPKVDLSQLDMPKVNLSRVDLSRIDLPEVHLPKVDLTRVDLPREIEERFPRRRRTNPVPFFLVGLAILAAGAWLVAWSPLAPRIRAAASDARNRLGMGPLPLGATDAADEDRLDQYDVDPVVFGGAQPTDDTSPAPAFEPDRASVDQERVATLGS